MREAIIALVITLVACVSIYVIRGSMTETILFACGGLGWAAIYAIFPRRR